MPPNPTTTSWANVIPSETYVILAPNTLAQRATMHTSDSECEFANPNVLGQVNRVWLAPKAMRLLAAGIAAWVFRCLFNGRALHIYWTE